MVAKSKIDKIREDLNRALKSQRKIEVSTLRLLLSALHNAQIEKEARREKLSGEDIIKVIRAEIRKRKESIEAFQLGQRKDLVEKEKTELSILEKYLPEQLSKSQLEGIITQVISETQAKSIKDAGRVMGEVMGKVKGRAEGGKISEMVRKILGEKLE